MTEEPDNTSVDSPAADAPAPAHRNRFLIGTLFTLATIIGVFAVLAVWVNRQALNTENWTSTSSQLLADKQIQTAVAAYAVDQLFKSGEPQAAIKSVLPARLDPLAGPLSAGLQQLAAQAAPRLLATSQAQSAWRAANHAAHSVFVKIVNGGGRLASTNGGVVTLNIHAIVTELAARLGVQSQVAAVQAKLKANSTALRSAAAQHGITIPASTGKLVILRSDQLSTVQSIARAIKGLALVLPIVAFALFILAVWLSRGHRQQALRTTGWCFALIGLVVLPARHLLGNYVVNNLVKNPDNRLAVHNVWTISTTLLYDIAAALIVYGLVLVAAAWLGGRTRPARTVRLALSPSLRMHPAAGYAVVYLALLLLVIWGPTPATRQLPYIIGFVVLLAIGVHTLRNQTAREFPDAQPGDAMRSIRSRNEERRAPGASAVASTAQPTNGDRVAELERLARLHDSGSLTDAEFAAEKATLSDGS